MKSWLGQVIICSNLPLFAPKISSLFIFSLTYLYLPLVIYKSITCGVPQCSILGPLLYLIYVHDIHKSCNSNILSFADDTTLFLSNSNIGSLYEEANKEINSLYMWFCANKLSLNAKKTKYIILKPHSKKFSVENRKLSIYGVSLERIGNDCVSKSTKM